MGGNSHTEEMLQETLGQAVPHYDRQKSDYITSRGSGERLELCDPRQATSLSDPQISHL